MRSAVQRATPTRRAASPVLLHKALSSGGARGHAPSPKRGPSYAASRSSQDSAAATAAMIPSATTTTSYGELEDVISDVMKDRLQSLAVLRRRIEELSELHRKEEQAFAHVMSSVLTQSAAVREAHLETEGGMEQALRRERQERVRAMELVERFKAEGTHVMEGLKDALRDSQRKLKAEVAKSQQLEQEVHRLRRAAASSSTDAHSGSKPHRGAVPHADHDAPTGAHHSHTPRTTAASNSGDTAVAVQTLSQLLEESDGVISELERRNRVLEAKVAHLTEQRDRLLDADALAARSGEFSREIQELLPLAGGADGAPNGNHTMGSGWSAAERVSGLSRLVHLVMLQLKSEQRQRLRTEEQAARMAAGNDELLRTTERRVKELETRLSAVPQGAGANAAAGGGAGWGAHAAGHHASASSSSGGQPSSMSTGGLVVGGQSLHIHGGLGGPHGPASSGAAGGSNVGPGTPPLTSRASMSSNTPTATTQSQTATYAVRGNSTASAAAALTQPTAAIPQPALTGSPRLGRAGASVASAPPASSVHVFGAAVGVAASQPAAVPNEPEQQAVIGFEDASLPSLEEQLSAVTRDFHASLQQWSDAIAQSPLGAVDAAARSSGPHAADAQSKRPAPRAGQSRREDDDADFLPESPPPAAKSNVGSSESVEHGAAEGQHTEIRDLDI